MLFNSIDFAVFLPIVFILYWFVFNRSLRAQNFLIVAASYVFYGWWDWRFLSLIVISSSLDFFIGRLLAREEQHQRLRKIYLAGSILVNLGFLGFFKYYNFFLVSFADAFSIMGIEIKTHTLNIILPVGISFYTFQALSYTIDVFRRKLEPSNDFIAFAAYVSFFPQLVAGPIERATHLLPQFTRHRVFDSQKAIDGLRQALWGLFKKVVIADNCAEYVNFIFDGWTSEPGSILALGAFLFAIQIYCDFSGYSDIAIGTARLFGFSIMKNFAYPYFSRDVAEFWRRWHISLSTWFRDYVYIPLGGSHVTTTRKVINTFIVFLASALWHGANWTFVAWGFLHAWYMTVLIVTRRGADRGSIVAQGRTLPTWKDALSIALTFCAVTFAWIFFRAASITEAFGFISQMMSLTFFHIPSGIEFAKLSVHPRVVAALITFLFIIEWIGREYEHPLENLGLGWPRAVRYTFYYALIVSLFMVGGKAQDFIYFQF